MSSIKTYDRTIREPRSIHSNRTGADSSPGGLRPAPPRSAPARPAGIGPDFTEIIQLPAHGWGPDQFGCLNSIWVRESGWNELAGHPASAYGIPQADPGSKMAAEGSDWLTNPQTQIRWGEDYIQSRYGTPCQAWAYWQARRY